MGRLWKEQTTKMYEMLTRAGTRNPWGPAHRASKRSLLLPTNHEEVEPELALKKFNQEEIRDPHRSTQGGSAPNLCSLETYATGYKK